MRNVLKPMKSIKGIALCAVLATGMLGCGSATSNDQGTSFTLLGFFAELPDNAFDCTDLPDPVLGVDVPLASFSDEGTTDATVSSGAVRAILGVQNNLSGEFVRTQYADIEYVIAGADVTPPSTRVAVGLVVRPSVPAADTTTGGATAKSSLPGSFTADTTCSGAFASFVVVPPDIRAWVNLNQGSLPEAPFVMNAIVRVSGQTSAGDTLTSNEAVYSIQFTPAIDIQSPEDTTGGTADVDNDTGGTSGATTDGSTSGDIIP